MDYTGIIIALAWIVLDVVCGTIRAAKTHQLDSSKMRDGLFHKIGYILCMGMGVGIDYTMEYMNIGFDIPVLEGICVMVVLTEIISVAENIMILNPELADWGIFKSIKSRDEK